MTEQRCNGKRKKASTYVEAFVNLFSFIEAVEKEYRLLHMPLFYLLISFLMRLS